MKLTKHFTTILSLLLGVFICTACSDDDPLPEITLFHDRIEVPSEGATNVEMKYTLYNPVEGIAPKMDCTAEWITDLKAANGIITFNVAASKEAEPREAEVVVSYTGALLPTSFFVTQAEGDPNLTFTVGDLSFKMIYIQAGTFTMGADAKEPGSNSWEKPSHKVTLTKDYYMGEYEVTQALWQEIMGNNPSMFKDPELKAPVDGVNYQEAQDFLAKLSAKTGQKFVLPTEAQWEFAARGGLQTKGYKFCGSNTVDDVAWYDGNAGFKTHAAGSKLPNELGIYDMSGNVMEWCSDWYGDYSADDQTDPVGPESNPQNYRVSRGGGLISIIGDVRIPFRAGSEAKSHMFFQGFRLAMVK